MKSNLTAEDLALISEHVGNILNQRIESTEEILSSSMKGLQNVNEINHNSIRNKLNEVDILLKSVEIQAKKTNGRVNKLEEEYEKNDKFKLEVMQYRFLYKKPSVIIVLFLLTCAFFIKESRDFIIDIIKILI